MKTISILSIFFTAIFLSCNPKAEIKPTPPEYFIEKVDTFLKKRYPNDYKWYLENKKEDIKIDTVLSNAYLTLSKDQCFIGGFGYSPIPVWCALYSINLQGTEEKEYIVIVSPAPVMENGGYASIFIYDTDKNKNKLLDTFEVSLKYTEFALDFKKLTSQNNYEMIVYSDMYLSVYENSGMHILKLENNSIKEIFLQTTNFINHLKEPNETESAKVIFKDLNRDSSYEIIVESQLSIPVDSAGSIVSEKKEIYEWNPDSIKYILK